MIVLRINNREVEDRQVIEEFELVKKHNSKNFSAPSLSNSIILQYAKENIINRVLLEEEAELMIEEVDFKLIQSEYNNLIEHYGSWEAMESHFYNQGRKISSHQVKINIEKSLKVNQLLNMWSKHANTPNEGEISSYYKNNHKQFTSPQQILFSKFFLSHQPASQNKLLMEGLAHYWSQVKNYQDFLNKAKQIPNLDYQEKFYLTMGKIQPEVESVLIKLADEEMSGIIQTEEGYFLFRRWGIIHPPKLEYDEVRDSIEKILTEEKKQKHIREHLSHLRKQATIEDFLSEEAFNKLYEN